MTATTDLRFAESAIDRREQIADVELARVYRSGLHEGTHYGALVITDSDGSVLWQRGDGWLIDGFGPDGVSARVLDVTRGVVRLQTGYLYHYAFAMLIGVAALITWFMFGGRAG